MKLILNGKGNHTYKDDANKIKYNFFNDGKGNATVVDVKEKSVASYLLQKITKYRNPNTGQIIVNPVFVQVLDDEKKQGGK